MEPLKIPYEATGRFQPIVLDYLAGRGSARDLFQYPPDLTGLRAAATGRNFDAGARSVLLGALHRQYHGISMHKAVQDNLEHLRSDTTLTVTTGHQLCLFLGPLYVPFKILNVIRLARTLTEELGRKVVPVFWMATEDHDRAEIDHAWINGRRVQWHGDVAGAVGSMRLEGIASVLAEALIALGGGGDVDRVSRVLAAHYSAERTLADATRGLVNELFGQQGLVVIDGDDAGLKRLFAPYMREELLNMVTQRTVDHAITGMEGNYAAQARPREINLFHLRPGHRSRITLDGDRFTVLDHGPSFSAGELLAELEQHPEKFSPNVLMRPLYQEVVLPNIAYIGGGGELAYWAQLRWLFRSMQVPMPVVLLRTSAAMIPAKLVRHAATLGLGVADLFKPLDALKAQVAIGRAAYRTDTDAERDTVNTVFDALVKRAQAVDGSLTRSVEARRAKALHGLERIAQGFLRAAKRSQQVDLDRLDRIHVALFPGGGLQERRDNILPLLADRGVGYLDTLAEQLDPLDARFTVLVEP